MTSRQQYQEKLDAQLAEWRARLQEFKAKADKAGADRRMDYQNKVDELSSKIEHTRAKIDDLKGSSPDVWDGMKRRVEQAARDTADSLNDLKRRMGM